MLKGMVILFIVYLLALWWVARSFELYRIEFVLSNFLNFLILAVLVVFQPELRRGLIHLSQTRLFSGLFGSDREKTINALVQAVTRMAKEKTGALIAIEKGIGLQAYTDGGVQLDSSITPELLETVFHVGTPLHDGGVVIRENRIVAAKCLFPLTDNPNVSRRIGTRHRAAIGLSEESDALVIVVSEETGLVSTAQRGQINRGLDREALVNRLTEFFRESAEIRAETATDGGL